MKARIKGAAIQANPLSDEIPVGASKIRESAAAIEFFKETEATEYSEPHRLGHAAATRFIHQNELDT